MTRPTLPPQASLRESWTVATVERLAWTMGRPAAAPRAGSAHATSSPARPTRPLDGAVGAEHTTRARRAEALLRLAMDAAAPPAERALAAERAAGFLRVSA
jgi:hypothetical protein